MVVKGGAAVAQRPQALDNHPTVRTLNFGEDNCLPLPSGERPVSTSWTGEGCGGPVPPVCYGSAGVDLPGADGS